MNSSYVMVELATLLRNCKALKHFRYRHHASTKEDFTFSPEHLDKALNAGKETLDTLEITIVDGAKNNEAG